MNKMNLSAIYYHHSNNLPIVCDVPSEEMFIRVCEDLPTDWAHLMDKETGEILHTWKKPKILKMRYTNVREFIECFLPENEESLWEMIDDYETFKETGSIGECLLRENARTFCSYLKIPMTYHTDYMEKIALGIYEYFAMKYKEIEK